MGILEGIALGHGLGVLLQSLGLMPNFTGAVLLIPLSVGLFLAFGARSVQARPNRKATLLFFFVALVIGGTSRPHRQPPSPPSGIVRLEGLVHRSRKCDTFLLYAQRGHRIEDGASVLPGTVVRLTLSTGAHQAMRPAAGSEITVLARLRRNHHFDNPSPAFAWRVPHRIDAFGQVLGDIEIRRRAPTIERIARDISHHIGTRLDTTLTPPAAALGRTLLLGETGHLSRDDQAHIRGAGLAHLLAVSGLHVALLAGCFVVAVRRILSTLPTLTNRCDVRVLSVLSGIPFALGYAFLVGDSPSAWRAAITATLIWTLQAMGRRPRPQRIVALTVLVMTFYDPSVVYRPGFLLSIMATTALISAVPQHGMAWWKSSLRSATRTFVATAPLVLIAFGQLPLVSIVANILAIPLASLLLIPTMACHTLCALCDADLARWIAPFVDLLSHAFFGLAHHLARFDAGPLLPPPSALQSLLLGIGAWVLLNLRDLKRTLLCCMLIGVCLFGEEIRIRVDAQPHDRLRLTFVDVGQGDATLIDLPDGRLMLIDAGGSVAGSPDPGERALLPLLRARRRDRIDVVVISHPHPDHYGGLEALLASVNIGEIWDTGQAEAETPGGPLSRLLESARARGIPIRYPDALCDTDMNFGGVRTAVLAPCPGFDPGYDANDNSLVLTMQYGTHRMLFAGDAEAFEEAVLLEESLPSIDLLKVPHHGSRTSSSAEFLDAVNPRIAVISCGRDNRFGHPHPAVLSRYEERDICTLRTDLDGGILVESDGQSLRVRTQGVERCASTP